MNFLGVLLFFVVFAESCAGGVFLIGLIPTFENPVLSILLSVVKMMLIVVCLCISALIGSLVSAPISKKAQEKLTFQKRLCFDKALPSWREYYGWTEPCVVTKCYDSSDKKFKNRDVCIFILNDELRITANLKHGFSIREKDLGCYAFKVDEFTVEQIQDEKILITELKSKDLFFRLGRRAKGFIEKRFISPKSDM